MGTVLRLGVISGIVSGSSHYIFDDFTGASSHFSYRCTSIEDVERGNFNTTLP